MTEFGYLYFYALGMCTLALWRYLRRPLLEHHVPRATKLIAGWRK